MTRKSRGNHASITRQSDGNHAAIRRQSDGAHLVDEEGGEEQHAAGERPRGGHVAEAEEDPKGAEQRLEHHDERHLMTAA